MNYESMTPFIALTIWSLFMFLIGWRQSHSKQVSQADEIIKMQVRQIAADTKGLNRLADENLRLNSEIKELNNLVLKLQDALRARH